MAPGWRLGIIGVVAFLVIALVLTSFLDAYLEVRDRPTIGARLRAWSWSYPLFSGAMILLFGALLAHLFLLKG